MRQVAQTFGNTTKTGQRSMLACWNAPGDATQSPAQMRPGGGTVFLLADLLARRAAAPRAAHLHRLGPRRGRRHPRWARAPAWMRQTHRSDAKAEQPQPAGAA